MCLVCGLFLSLRSEAPLETDETVAFDVSLGARRSLTKNWNSYFQRDRAS